MKRGGYLTNSIGVFIKFRALQEDSRDGIVGYLLPGDFQCFQCLPDGGACFLRVDSFEFKLGGPAETLNVFDSGEKTVTRDFPETCLFLSQREPEFEAELFQQCPARIERACEQRQFAFGVKRAFELQIINRDNFQLDEVNGGFFFRLYPLSDSDVLLNGVPMPCRRPVVVVGKFVWVGNFRPQAAEPRLKVFNVFDAEPDFAFVWSRHGLILTFYAEAGQ